MGVHRNIVKNALIIVATLLQCFSALKFEDEAAASNQKIANISSEGRQQVEGRQSARHLFDFVGLGTGNHVDPFLRKTNEKCLNGELSECFKSQALNTFDDLFKRDVYV
jgi:hypothetical protein